MAQSTILILLVMLTGHFASTAHADEFQTAINLIKENKHEQAYIHLTTEEAYHIGEPAYDILLARSALKTNRPHEAIFAYERVLISQPSNHPARLELAIAYFQINELESSKRLLLKTSKANPPDRIQNDIQQYLELIEQRLDARRHSLGFEVQLRQGYDSNINSATNESAIELKIGTYRPTEGVDKETSDTFTELVTRLNYNYNFNVNSHIYSNVAYTNKENNNEKFDTQTANVQLGYSHKTSIGRFSFPVSYQTVWLDEKQIREVSAISTNLNRHSDGSYTDYNLQYGQIRYPGQTPLDVDFNAVSFAFGFTNQSRRFSQQYAIFYGDETATNDIYRFNARTYQGLQIRFPWQISQKHMFTPKLVYQESEYKQKHAFFKNLREDEYSYYELNWQWFLTRRWSLNTQLSHTESESTVPIYTHDRNMIFMGIRYKN